MPDDVEILLAFHAAYNGRDLDGAVALCASDVRVAPDASVFPEAARFVGHDALRSFLEETWLAWTGGSVTPQQVRELGDGRVLVQADWSATGSASGAEVATNLSAIYTVRGGKIASAEYFFNHDEALKVVGLGH